jgi:hypothetical protein
MWTNWVKSHKKAVILAVVAVLVLALVVGLSVGLTMGVHVNSVKVYENENFKGAKWEITKEELEKLPAGGKTWDLSSEQNGTVWEGKVNSLVVPRGWIVKLHTDSAATAASAIATDGKYKKIKSVNEWYPTFKNDGVSAITVMKAA